METFKTILTKLDIRQYDSKKVPAEVKLKVLEAARASGTGNNRQEWRFILVQEKETLKRLAEDSISGGWVGGASFAVVVLSDPTLGFHLIDAGRAVQNMELAAWDEGVISGIYTGIKDEKMRKDFAIPISLKPVVVVGFGYPVKRIVGKKNRMPLTELASIDKFGNKFDPKKVI
jgi:nitroreductase